MPAIDTIDFEREFKELVRELRALPTAAPERIRERVRALGEPAERRRLPVVPWRRAVLVLAPACVLALVAAAVIHGVLNSSPKREVTLAPQRERAAAVSSAVARTVGEQMVACLP